MPFQLSVLGSGSGGNGTLLRLEPADGGPARLVLIDVGFSPRELTRRLARYGHDPCDVSDVLLTHLDGDHLHRHWAERLVDVGVRVHVHHRHRHEAVRRGLAVRAMDVYDEGFDLGETRVEPVPLAHDQLGTVGFVIEHRERRLGFATDLGRVTAPLLEAFRGLHVLAIESNYDPAMQRRSDRPEFLKHRIMGGSGHLSNEQALEAVVAIAGCSTLSRVVLLHLSRQCNEPGAIETLYATRAPGLADLVTVSRQDEPTELLAVEPGRAAAGAQMGLFSG